MLSILYPAIAFVVLHRIVSAGRMRRPLATRLGEKAFQRLFSIASAACLAWLWFGYLEARQGVAGEPLFVTPGFLVLAQIPIQLAAVVLIVAGLTTRNPTTSGMSDLAADRDIVRGFIRITRHPFLWGISLFSVGHMMAAPTFASWGFFGTLAFLAITGAFSIDAKRRRALGDDWEWFASVTSNLPFLAIGQGRQRFSIGELGWWRLLIALVCYALLMRFHPLLFGHSAVPS